MSGDKFKARVNAWYQPSGMDNTTDPILNNIIDNLLSQLTPGISAAGKGTVAAQITNSTVQPGMQSFLNTQAPASSAPRAYLNWVLLDEEQFKPVTGNNGFAAVPAITGAAQKQLLQANGGSDITIQKNGYLYVYVSNESKGNVYFDDIRVEHTRGALLEETHYYPFGLTMSGISSKAAGGLENKKKYNGIEFDNDLDINTYEAFYRNLDPQIGRWWQIDPKCEVGINPDIVDEDEKGLESLSPYNSMGNDPIKHSDPKGDIFGIDNLIGAAVGVAIDYGVQVGENLSSGKSWEQSLTQVDGKSLATSAAIGFVTSGVGNVAGKLLTKAGSAVVTKLEPAVAKLAQSNVAKQVGKVGKDIIEKTGGKLEALPHSKMIKSIVKNASKDGVKLPDNKIAQLKRVVEKSGGTVRTEVGTTKNVKGVLHSQVEGYGTQTSSRHIIHATQ